MKKYLMLVTTLAVFVLGCQRDEFVEDFQVPSVGSAIVLGDKLSNPYAISNMRQAFEKLTSNGNGKARMAFNLNMRITHKYVKFLLQSEEEE